MHARHCFSHERVYHKRENKLTLQRRPVNDINLPLSRSGSLLLSVCVILIKSMFKSRENMRSKTDQSDTRVLPRPVIASGRVM